ncbi:MAG: 23S rRNA (pseudouridine(1915)-N(3))-methyltransferase RlmH [Thermoplasmata archaeon]|nr:MAG: 23S rRNA (pseudouridine(1915)-N(3))-methyltransferase RlmH [Thermoplasmata archaeon]
MDENVRIILLCGGRLREGFFREAASEYTKRIRRFARIEVREMEDLKSLERILDSDDYLIALDENGREMTSLEFAELVKKIYLSGKDLYLIIGGWSGIEERIKRRADLILSLSRMTFPYQLARIMILEQIYRAFSLLRGIDYHK